LAAGVASAPSIPGRRREMARVCRASFVSLARPGKDLRGEILRARDAVGFGSTRRNRRSIQSDREDDMHLRTLIGVVGVAALGTCLALAHADEKTPDAKIKLSAGSVSAGVGVHWGNGTLTYHGKEYPIEVKGLSVGDVGATRIAATGDVYNLSKLEDFDGNYTAVGAGAAIGGGGSAATMRNQNGVTVELVSTTQGVKVAIGGGGVEMKLKD
jgi:hypothetical protein